MENWYRRPSHQPIGMQTSAAARLNHNSTQGMVAGQGPASASKKEGITRNVGGADMPISLSSREYLRGWSDNSGRSAFFSTLPSRSSQITRVGSLPPAFSCARQEGPIQSANWFVGSKQKSCTWL